MNASRLLFHFCALIVISALLFACAAPATPPAPTSLPAPIVASNPMSQLIAAAQAEGTLVTMALPRDWCNWGDVIDTFKTRYGMQVTELKPSASSAEVIAAVKAQKDDPNVEAPDAIEVGYAYNSDIIDGKLSVPYKVAAWDSLPFNLSDPNGYWFGDYYGIVSFEVNKDFVENVPQDWGDLLKPEYKNQVALSGDPRISSQAQMAVFGSALANGGSVENALPGLAFFKQLYQAGNFVPLIATSDSLASGRTPIVIRWDFTAQSHKKALAGKNTILIVTPKTGLIAGMYIQSINANAKHPSAARLWMEYLYSDEGQLNWLRGGCHPIRYDDLIKRKLIPLDMLADLPPAEPYGRAVFPSSQQIVAARKIISENWSRVVGANVK